jgi:hypothetical protein
MLTKDVRRALRDRLGSWHRLLLFYLQIEIDVRLLFVFRTKCFVLFINVQNEFLDVAARNRVFLMVSRTHLDVERLTGAFLVAATLAPKSELNLLLFNWRFLRNILTAQLNYSLHVAPFGTYQPSSNLKLPLVVNLNVKSTSVPYDVLGLLILSLLTLGGLNALFRKLRTLL